MAVATNRVFRVERANKRPAGKPSIVSVNATDHERHEEIMTALEALREHADPQEALSQQVVETCQRDLQEAQKIKDELIQIHNAIADTKREIATLHDAGREDLKVSLADHERHEEIMTALEALREHADPQEALSQQVVETCQRDLQEAQKIKDELIQIHNAIADTKREIATLHDAGREDLKVSRMTDELGAIVEGTEEATEMILSAAELIDNNATDLIATLRQQANKDQACDIQEQVVKIFEACNFQDLTGQRITKVVNAFCFIEQRVDRMMEIWGGIEGFKDVEKVDLPSRTDHEELLNGPALEEDEDTASQDDIDALFD